MASNDCESITTAADANEEYKRRIDEFSELVNQANPDLVNSLPDRVKCHVKEHLANTNPSALDRPLSFITAPSKEAHPYLYYGLKPLYMMYLAAHYLGGKLSWMFGITSPAYQDAIDMTENQLEREAREEND